MMVAKGNDVALQREEARAKFLAPETARVWSEDMRYHPDSNRGLFAYNDKLYRMRYVLEEVPPAKNSEARALDLGCGTGPFLRGLSARGYRVTGLDVAPSMLERARTVCATAGIQAELILGDCVATKLPDASFEACIAVGLIEHFSSDAPLLREVHRLLKPGATFVVTTRNLGCPHKRWEAFLRRWAASMRARLSTSGSDGAEGNGATRPYASRQHDVGGFRKRLVEAGFRPMKVRYSHFYLLPYPLSALLPRVDRPFGKMMERLNDTPLGLLGSTAIFTTEAMK